MITISILISTLALVAGDVRNVSLVEAKAGEFPYMVSIQFKDYGHVCGGALISKQWVVTTSVCLENKDIKDIYAQFHISVIPNNQSSINIKAIIRHPNFSHADTDYKAYKWAHDVGLIQLEKPVAISPFIQPIEVASFDNLYVSPGAIGVLTVYQSGIITKKDNLKRLFVKIQGDPARCEYYNENHYHNNNTYYLCVVQTNALRYHPSNHANEGSPLALNGKLVGLYSHAINHCVDYKPYCATMYAKVQTDRDWIMKVLDRYGESLLR